MPKDVNAAVVRADDFHQRFAFFVGIAERASFPVELASFSSEAVFRQFAQLQNFVGRGAVRLVVYH